MLATARRTLLLSLAFLLLHAAEGAAFYRWIHELSGPRNFHGVSMYAMTDFRDRITEWGGLIVLEFDKQAYERPFWLRATGAITYSGDEERAASSVYWLSAEPTFEARLTSGARHLLYTGAGVSVNRFLGSGFEDFWELSWKVMPIALDWQISETVTLKARAELDYFPTPPTPEDFGLAPPSPPGSGGEWVKGVSIAVVLLGRR